MAQGLGLVAGCFYGSQALGDPDISTESLKDIRNVQQKTEYGFRNGSFIVAPVPFSNPAIGSGLALGVGYLFKTDPSADTSVVGIGAMQSSNGSQAHGLTLNLALPENKWTFDATFAEADIRYDLFVGDLKIPIRQDGTLAQAGLSYGITPDVSVGGTLRYLDTTVGLDVGGTFLPPDILPDLGLELLSVGAVFGWDTRDNSDYPTKGFRLSIDANRGQTLSGPSRHYEYGKAIFDTYHSFSPSSVVATRLSTCAAGSNAPFFEQCSIGFTDGFRGFSPTQYLDTRLVSAQLELRQRLGKRLGVVAFGGMGWTSDSFGTLDDAGTQAAVGLGLRYRVSEKFPVDFSIDVSHNDLDEDFLYIFVGQRF